MNRINHYQGKKNSGPLNLKQNNENKVPEVQVERFLLVKVNEDEHEIKNLLAQHGINFEDFVVQSIADA